MNFFFVTERIFDLFFDELIHLLRCAAHIVLWIQNGLEVDAAKSCILLQPVDQVIGEPMQFHLGSGIMGMRPNSFMQFLAVASDLVRGIVGARLVEIPDAITRPQFHQLLGMNQQALSFFIHRHQEPRHASLRFQAG